ncbi:hypothetical protein VN12_21590 [Pirellula sp. SH-Sr6A]|uniref:hypothetical protein n=1 Tax=Pirellula sp. SH-Sr6A TaxID=1632865 RepID=UPI00078ECBEF|nr:hypothetical protein [Pirellula sp. SH-Sr6A]AMV34734.1 hypothetical protein VN12_21590 [Pirellula sp. SH-Sr6A]
MESRLSSSRRDGMLLYGAAGCSFLVLAWSLGALQPIRQVDTESYENFPSLLSPAALEQTRTFVYPIFLKIAGALLGARAVDWLPCLQSVIWVISIGVWGGALRSCRFPRAMALGASLPLYGLPFAWRYTSVITPDLLACSFSLLAASAWLVAIYFPKRWGMMVMAGVWVFAAYQTKPVYLFLLPWLPIATWIARGWLFDWDQESRRSFYRASFIAIVPFFAWCTLRWVLVGHFGLVSFGGYNIVGISGQFVAPEHLPGLSEKSRELGDRIIAERSKRSDWDTSGAFDSVSRQFNPMVWEIAVPIASELEEGEPKKINARLSQFSREVLMASPKEYGVWLLRAMKHAAIELARSLGGNPLVWVAIAIVGWFWCNDWLRMQERSESSRIAQQNEVGERSVSATAIERMRAAQTIVWLAIGWSLGKMLLVILVEPPNERYAGPASLFLASAFVIVVLQVRKRDNS